MAHVQDTIHGTIHFDDYSSANNEGKIGAVLAAPMMRRLRFMKQNPFAAYQYLSADHTRYSHAIGTMQVARKILNRVRRPKSNALVPVDKVKQEFPGAFKNAKARPLDIISQHILAAALLQDIGELPYQFVTKHFFKLHEDDMAGIKNKIGVDGPDLTPKDAFTIACMFSPDNDKFVRGLDWELLAYLIAGRHLASVGYSKAKVLAPILCFLDGVIDADRLDYVFRDAYHTLGYKGSPDGLIETISHYDHNGPILTDVGPVVEFFTLRSNLWRNVYLGSAVRFRIALLLEVLKGIKSQADEKAKNSAAYEHLKDRKISFHLRANEFLGFDDQSLWMAIGEIYQDGTLRGSLSNRSQKALKILLGHSNDYEAVWLKGPDTPIEMKPRMALPDDLFWDTYEELIEHRLYGPGSVRIVGREWSNLGNPVLLENCVGPFASFLQAGAMAHPMPGCVQLFKPPESMEKGTAWETLHDALDTGQLFHAIRYRSANANLEIPTDTYTIDGFTGPKMAISFRTDNIRFVDEICRFLFEKKRRYKVLRDPNDSQGTPTLEASIRLIDASEASLVVLSREYTSEYKAQPGGNIHAEVHAIIAKREANKKYRAGFVSLDEWKEVKDDLPFNLMKFSKEPFFGPSLRNKLNRDLRSTMAAVLRYIDGE